MNANSATKPRMMPIKNLAKNGPVGVLKRRCTTVSESGFFQVKMALLVTAVVFHFALRQTVARAGPSSLVRLVGLAGLALWVGLALAACAFILLE